MKNILYEETPMRGEFPRYRRPQLGPPPGRIVTFVILISFIIVLVVGGLAVTVRMFNPTLVHTTEETRTFHLVADTQPTLNVLDNNGFVRVHPGAGNIVTVLATKKGDSFEASPDDFKVSYSQSGNTISIQVSNDSIHPFDFSTASQADLDVTIPARSDLRLETNSGDISVTGVRGKMTLISDSGSLQATGVSLKSVSLLSTNSGSITMRGSIDTVGRYTFQANSGSVDVILPRNTSFHADLKSNSGTITNDFPIAATQQSGTEGPTISDDIGSSPQSTVVIQSNSGSLHLGQM